MIDIEGAIEKARQKPRLVVKRPSLGNVTRGCATCPPVGEGLPGDALLNPGMGETVVRANGVDIWDWEFDGPSKYVSHFTELARANADLDWTIFFNMPLRSALYQWQGYDGWILIEVGDGFA
jgi:hypothetical protein